MLLLQNYKLLKISSTSPLYVRDQSLRLLSNRDISENKA